jgi:DNA invertase Pin-like site-specific DNA recombinase
MRTQTLHANVTKTAIGYVRVSTQEQATEGVSLDAQRDRLRSYCKANDIRLIDIIGDEGISGSTLERPGLQAALHLIRRGRANTLIVVKLDRLSRSLRDVCALVEDYFADERHHLLSVCGMVNTHSAAGRMLMMNLANFNQFEREMVSERTRDALQHLKAQGVRLGHAPYGYEHGKQIDEKGHRILVPLACEQEVIDRMAALHTGDARFRRIARQLNAEGFRARRGGDWCAHMVSVVLQREGKYAGRKNRSSGPRPPRRHDKPAAAALAHELRAQGLSLREIGVRLRKEGLVPLRGGKWHPASVGELLRYRDPGDRAGAAQRASELRAQGLSLREVGVRLAMEGYAPESGGAFYPALVHALLSRASAANCTEQAAMPDSAIDPDGALS